MEWRTIQELGNAYEVSEYGDIRRIAWGKGAQPGLILKPFLHRKGYLSIAVTRGVGKKTRGFVHKFVALAFLGPRPKDLEINHKDGNKLNNHYLNLEYVSRRKNYDHAISLHLHAHGEAHTHAKLTEEKVKEIRRRYKNGERMKDLAREFGVSDGGTLVPLLIKKRTWKHVPEEE